MQGSSHISHLLIVDDVEDNRDLLVDLFSLPGFAPVAVASVAAARDAIKATKQPYDMILSDISMPEETGFDLLAWRNEQRKDIKSIPILLITAALPEDEYRVRGLSMGAVDYVVRPISNQELVLRVQMAIDHHQKYSSLKTAFEDSQDLATVGRLLAAANHEIRNLSTLILLTSEQVVRIFQKPDNTDHSIGQQALRSLEKSAKLLASMSHNLNATVGKNQPRLTTVNLSDIITDVIDLIAIKAHAIRIERKFDDQLQTWSTVDETRLKQILINFLLNAIDSIAEASTTSVGLIEIRITEAAEHWQVRITDDGVGFSSPSGRLSDFQPFTTTKSIRGGKGLGLWWSMQLASGMNCRIELQSEGTGKGATAILSAPKTTPPVNDHIDLAQYLID